MSSPTLSLLRLRRSSWRHRLHAYRPTQRPGVILAALALLALLLGIGHWAAPSLMIPPIELSIPTGREPRLSLIPGARALDLAFWLTALASAVASFRIMELLFRRKDVRQLQALPLNLRAYFVDRVMYGAFEVLGLSALLSIVFVPLYWHGQAWVATSCIFMCVGGTLATFCAGLGVQLYAGYREFGHIAQEADAQVVGADGQVFIFAPGGALLISVILILFLKLALGEVIRLQNFARPTWLALGVTLACCIAGLGMGYAYFKKCYFRVLAGFREVDFVGFKVEVDYQVSAFDKPSWSTKLVQPSARPVYQRHRLQYSRKHMLMRYAYGVMWVLYALGLWRIDEAAWPTWAAVAVALGPLCILARPWTRLEHRALSTAPIHALPIAQEDERNAASWFTLREALGFVLPMVASLALIRSLTGPTNPAHPLMGAGAILGATLCIHGAYLGATSYGASRVVKFILMLLVAMGATAGVFAHVQWASLALLVLGALVMVAQIMLSSTPASGPSPRASS